MKRTAVNARPKLVVRPVGLFHCTLVGNSDKSMKQRVQFRNSIEGVERQFSRRQLPVTEQSAGLGNCQLMKRIGH